MKFATYVMTFDQGKWIMRNLENAYPHVDRIYVMHSHLPWRYKSNAREKYVNTIVMTYCGEPIKEEQLKSHDIQKQLLNIIRILMENHCFYNDFTLKNVLILDNKIRLIDFEWCPMIKEDYTCNGIIDSKLTHKPCGNFFTLFDLI